MKNKYQEALNFLDWHCGVSHIEQQKTLQELVDKEIPMKPTLKRGIYGIRCSKCGNPNLNTKWTHGRYCSGCGQRIDWSDEE